MALDGADEQRAVLARLGAMCDGRVHDGMPDDTQIEKKPDGSVKPYLVVWFDEPIPDYNDRSIMGEAQQPYIQGGIVECWGANADIVRDSAGAARVLLLGWNPLPPNTTEIRGGGGGSFRQRDTAGGPSRSMRAVSFEYGLNMSVDITA